MTPPFDAPLADAPLTDPPLTDAEYRSLAEFRHALRRFLAFSEHAARDHGITPAQHQLLLALRGFGSDDQPLSTSDIADLLELKLHSASELLDRTVTNELVERHADPDDARRVLITLSDEGRARLDSLSLLHRRELRTFRTELAAILDQLD